MGETNLITDVPGLTVGQASDAKLLSGVTVVVGDEPMVAGVHVMGGAPGTRETDLLAPDKTVRTVDALVLSGGSAFGLAAADGVMAGLHADGRGFEARGHRVPIVPAAIIFDLPNGGDKSWIENPYPALSRQAYEARASNVALGSEGAGTGATCADLMGGLGSASAVMPSGAIVGALATANPVGQVTHGEGPHFWAAPFEQDQEFGGLGPALGPAPPARTKHDARESTAIAVVATDLDLDPGDVTRMATAAHDGIARAIYPSHTPFDGDLVFAASTGRRTPTDEDRLLLGHVAAVCLARAIARGVYHARPNPANILPTWSEKFA